jgi:catechol 2,3-dioxygenase-like lactoylglutathione lyase family enzyme
MDALPRVHFSHMGINVTDPGAMEDFYCRVLGFAVSDRGELGDGQKIVPDPGSRGPSSDRDGDLAA